MFGQARACHMQHVCPGSDVGTCRLHDCATALVDLTVNPCCSLFRLSEAKTCWVIGLARQP
eukprot:12885133-Alexandrium_andersonii.AAC.1